MIREAKRFEEMCASIEELTGSREKMESIMREAKKRAKTSVHDIYYHALEIAKEFQ